jgi:hypothetical protein
VTVDTSSGIRGHRGAVADTDPPGLTTQHPDDFLLDAPDLAPTAVLAAVHAVAARTGRHGPAHSPHDLAEHLRKTGAPAFAATVLDQLTRSE